MKDTRLFTRLLLLCMLVVAGLSVPTTDAGVPVQVKLEKQATVIDHGQAANVRVRVRCDRASGQLLESLVYVVQDGQTSQFASIPVTCDGRWHGAVIRVAAFSESPFHQGQARASAYVLLLSPATGDTVSGSDTRILNLR